MAFFVFCFWQYGISWATLVWISFFSLLVLLFFIDLTSFYLPNLLTFPLAILGIVCSLLGFTNIDIKTSVIGLIFGFLIFFVINRLYRIWRGIDGFGDADKILLAGLGGWFGFKSLYPIIMFSSFFGLGFALIMLALGQKFQVESKLPFGPFLILSGILVYVHLHIYSLTFMRFFYEI